MPVIFRNSSGEIIRIVHGECNPEKYKDRELPKDRTWEIVTEEKIRELKLPKGYFKTKLKEKLTQKGVL